MSGNSVNHGVCPFCPYVCGTNKLGQIRSDHLRSHVGNKHADGKGIIADYIGPGNFKMRKMTDTIYLASKDGKDSDAFCMSCSSWVSLSGYKSLQRADACLSHVCKTKQVRERKLKTVGGKPVPAEKKLVTEPFIKAFKRHGFEDVVELTDDIELDIDKTLVALKTQRVVSSKDSILERAKADKRLIALGLAKREEERRAAIEEANEYLEEGDEPEVFDEYDEIIGPCLVELSKTVPQREQLTNTIKSLRADLDKKEDELDMIKRQKNAEIEDLKERLKAMSIQLTEERLTLRDEIQQLKARLPPEEEEPVVEVTDTIQLVVENNYQQWSLPFQG